MGRVGVIGGSKDYTGAPYYAAKASLLFGGDLVSVFCSSDAALPLKCYSPELMVTPLYDVNDLDTMDLSVLSRSLRSNLEEVIGRLHVLVVGPGMGRNEKLLFALPTVLTMAKDSNIPVVIDADGLYMVSQNLGVVRGNTRCLLTPNANEFKMLLRSVETEVRNDQGISLDMCSSDTERLRALCTSLSGPAVLLKGKNDVICALREDGKVEVHEIIHDENQLSPRRCGGQGDILAGSAGVALHWALNMHHDGVDTQETGLTAMASAAVLASMVTKRASYLAYRRRGRATITTDILEHIGEAFESVNEW